MESRSFSVQHKGSIKKKRDAIAAAKSKLALTLLFFVSILAGLIALILWHVQETLHQEVLEHYQSWSQEIARDVRDVLLDQAHSSLEDDILPEPIYPQDNFEKISFETLLPPSMRDILHVCLLDESVLVKGSDSQALQFCQENPLFELKLGGDYKGYALRVALNDRMALRSQRITWQLSLAFALVLLWGVYVVYQLAISHLEAARQQNEFVSAVSHELRTPLTTIRMHSESLENEWIEKEKQSEYFSMIRQESERLSRLIENVLTLSGLQHESTAVQLIELSGTQIRDMIKDLAEPLCKQAGYTLEFQADPEDVLLPALVSLDKDRCKQIMINLVDNALKFSKDAAEKKIVAGMKLVHEEDSGPELLAFFVRDFGPGIDPSQRDLIFDLFYRAEDENTRSSKGTGIGLGLAYQLAESMGAALRFVDAEPGAEFRLLFQGS